MKIKIILTTGSQNPMEFTIKSMKLDKKGNLFRITTTDDEVKTWPLSTIGWIE